MWEPRVDVLTDVLNALELKGWLHSRTEVVPPWRFEFAASPDSVFHILAFGGGYLWVDGDSTPLRVEDGDVLMFPHGQAHTLCDDPASPLTQAVRLDYDPRRDYQVFPFAGEGPTTVMLCGAFHFEHPSNHPLLHGLPNVIHIPGEQGCMAPGFADLVGLLARESATRRAGTEVMLRRLTELLFIQVVRVWIERQAPATGGWLGALRDPPIAAALELIHQAPGRGWKVEELADAVALSRSAFSARFTRLVGEPPTKYLTRWRMHTATRLLTNGAKVETIARQLGYDSDVAFRKAFRREVGLPPARYRRLGNNQLSRQRSSTPRDTSTLEQTSIGESRHRQALVAAE
jgi:AraC-like DNA-binding protein